MSSGNNAGTAVSDDTLEPEELYELHKSNDLLGNDSSLQAACLGKDRLSSLNVEIRCRGASLCLPGELLEISVAIVDLHRKTAYSDWFTFTMDPKGGPDWASTTFPFLPISLLTSKATHLVFKVARQGPYSSVDPPRPSYERAAELSKLLSHGANAKDRTIRTVRRPIGRGSLRLDRDITKIDSTQVVNLFPWSFGTTTHAKEHISDTVGTPSDSEQHLIECLSRSLTSYDHAIFGALTFSRPPTCCFPQAYS